MFISLWANRMSVDTQILPWTVVLEPKIFPKTDELPWHQTLTSLIFRLCCPLYLLLFGFILFFATGIFTLNMFEDKDALYLVALTWALQEYPPNSITTRNFALFKFWVLSWGSPYLGDRTPEVARMWHIDYFWSKFEVHECSFLLNVFYLKFAGSQVRTLHAGRRENQSTLGNYKLGRIP